MIYFVALLELCGAYLQGGIDKVLDFESAVAEVRHFGLEAAAPMATATIITELCGSVLILIGFRWLGALWLAGSRSWLRLRQTGSGSSRQLAASSWKPVLRASRFGWRLSAGGMAGRV
jgi:DoxX